ncbi:hypothetical protein [Rhizobium sp. BK068]|uniref:hypothetical protein n=1 Tax=Rhizobium sp. BK068 TaxID=2512130 RepID=UPI001052CA89|nr:hypothetical protein [Rhizobium sp. BK068]TCM62370.1 hypothetical protein EV291_15315 [Rhizobium sp. BK068]
MNAPIKLFSLLALILVYGAPLRGAELSTQCWSLMNTTAWQGVLESARKTKLCEGLPGGPDRTHKFEPIKFDICSDAEGVKIAVAADIECKSSPSAFLSSSISTRATADVTLNVGACLITDSKIGFSGDGGAALAGIGNIQELAKTFAQAELTKFCGQ